jgi:glycosyltransferase involved in cell wall biosynthesis
VNALVRHAHYRIQPGGGPHGYLHNLRAALVQRPADQAIRIDVQTLDATGVCKPSWRDALRSFVERTPGLRGVRHRIRGEFALRFQRAEADWRASYADVSARDAERLLACDVFFAHETLLAERLLALQPRAARERVVLMTHAPSFYAHQIAGDLLPDVPETDWRDEPGVGRLREREVETMLAVKAVIWPSPGAADGYREWVARASVRPPLVTTGVPRPVPRANREEMRRRWEIGEVQKVALFLGRPHPQKGFDIFLDWAGRRDPGWVFVQAGGPPRHTQRDLSALRQVGYEADNGAAYCAADLVVFPNRYAYLDIGLLECLSLGAPVAVSAVGGHADLLRVCPDLLTIPEGPDAWPVLASAAEGEAEATRRARRQAAWAGRYDLRSFLRAHEAAAKALVS